MKNSVLALLFLSFCPALFAQDSEQEVFDVVEQMAEFPGGKPALVAFLSNNMKYPDEAKENGIQGKVFVQFIIAANGAVLPESIKVLKGVHPLLDKEAIRVVKMMPKWKPASNRGVPVASRYTLPINFKLNAPAK